MSFIVIICIIVLSFIAGFWVKGKLNRQEINYLKKQIIDCQKSPDAVFYLKTHGTDSNVNDLINELNILFDLIRQIIKLQQQNERMLRSDLENISHDLRTPLTAIYGYQQLLLDESINQEQKYKYLQISLSRTKALQDMIQSLFYLAKLENRTVELKNSEFDLSNLIGQQLAASYEMINQANFDVKVEIDPNTPLYSDQQAVERIINNALSNASQHGKDQLSLIHKKLTPNHYQTIIKNIIGDNEDIAIDQVFDRHYIGSSSRTQEHGGLGMTIIKELCSQLNHEVKADIEDEYFVLTIDWYN